MSTVTISNTCLICGQPNQITVDADRFNLWKSGVLLIQNAFPDLTLNQREALMTGTHGGCWDDAFEEDDDDEDDEVAEVTEDLWNDEDVWLLDYDKEDQVDYMEDK